MRHVVLIIATGIWAHAQPGSPEPPAIFQNGVFNSASRFPRTLPGGVIAPGARFTIQGVRLGAKGSSQVEVRSGARSQVARLLSVSPGEIEAILPATVPPGDASVAVLVNGKASTPVSIRVQSSAPGLYSANHLGWGAIAQTGSAAPGGTVELSATGIGGRVPEVFVGGRKARASVRPKTGAPGIDELVLSLPRDVPEGCHVPVYTQTRALVSNVVSLRVSRHGPARTAECSDTLWPAARESNATIVLYQMGLTIEVNPGDLRSSIEEQGAAAFTAPGSPLPPIRVLPPAGTCMGVAGTYQTGEGGQILFGLNLNLPGMQTLDAGRQIEISGNGATRKLTARKPGFFSQSLALRANRVNDRPAFLFPGDYTIAGSGGPAAGAFQTKLHVATPLVWIDRERFNLIDRRRGATLKWAGHDPSRPVIVMAFSVDRFSTVSFASLCVAAPGATEFTIPPAMLANLPATDESPGLPLSYLAVLQSPSGSMAEIRAPGIFGFAIYFGGGGRSVVYY